MLGDCLNRFKTKHLFGDVQEFIPGVFIFDGKYFFHFSDIEFDIERDLDAVLAKKYMCGFDLDLSDADLSNIGFREYVKIKNSLIN